MAFTGVTLTASFSRGDGSAATGQVRFRLTEPIANGVDVRTTTEVVASLDGSGNLSVELAANDDSDTVPAGTSYTVTEQITGAPVRDYAIVVPAAQAPTIALSALMPSTPGIA